MAVDVEETRDQPSEDRSVADTGYLAGSGMPVEFLDIPAESGRVGMVVVVVVDLEPAEPPVWEGSQA